MSTTAITTAILALNTRSVKLDPVNGGGTANSLVATTATDGWVLSPPAGLQFDERLVLVLGTKTNADTFTVKAGNRYPAQRIDLGDMTVAGSADDVRYIAIETSRFLKNDGTIVITATQTTSTVTAVMLPKAA